MKTKLGVSHWIGILALLLILTAGIFVAKWAITQHSGVGTPAVETGVAERLSSIISPTLLEVMGSRVGDEPRVPRADAIESLLAGADDVTPPSEEKLAGLSAQTRETLRLRYNLGLLKFHQNDTPGALAAFASVLEIDPQGAFGMRSFIQMGIIHSLSGNHDAAAEHFAKASALEPNDPIALHNLGVTLLKLKRVEEAIQKLSKAAALDGANVGILQNLGNAHIAAGAMESAIKTYKQALQIEPANAEVNFNIGLACVKTNDLAAADDHFSKAAEGLTGDEQARAAAFLGIVRYNRGFFGQAAKEFARAARLAPQFVDYKFNEGVAYAKSGMPEEATAAFRAALERTPGDASMWFGLGSSYYMNDRRKEALEAYNKGLAIDTTATSPLFTSGFILMEAGDVKAASERFKRVIELGGADAPRAHVNLGLCYEAMGMLEDAAKEYQNGTPDDPRTHYNLGLVRRRLGDGKGAVEAFLCASELKPADARYAAALGDAYFEVEMLSAAVGAYERAIKNGGEDFEILIRIAQLQSRLEKIDAAVEYVGRAVKAAGNGDQKARAHIAEGLVFDRRGDLDAALHAFRQSVAADPRNHDAYYNLGVIEARLRSYDAAVDALRVAIRLKPDHAAAHTQLGNIFAARGLKAEAMKEYEAAVRIDSGAVEASFNLRELSARP